MADPKGAAAARALPQSSVPLRALYQSLSRFPSPVHASLGKGFFGASGGAQSCYLYTEWCQPDLGRCEQLQFSRQYVLHYDGKVVLSVTPLGLPAEIQNQLLITISPTGRHKAILTHHFEMGQKQEVLEVWSNSGRVRNVNLTALNKHGKVYTDGQFGCLSWSSTEEKILYVAEKRRPKKHPHFPQDSFLKEREKPGEVREEQQFVYYDNWGEALDDKSVPVLCVLNIDTSEVLVLDGIPEYISPGQALWSPDHRNIVFVGWWHEPFRLGLSACSNRRSALFLLDLFENCCEQLSSDDHAVSSPRLSPDGTRLIYLEGQVFGPHQQCLKLQMLAVELALQMAPLDPNRIALLGGSHGGFICCHLIGQYPDMYRVCAVRSPVINMATLLGTSDIPDWRYAALGVPYCCERIPTEKDMATMLLSSPIIHAAKVQAPVLLCVGARDRRVSPYQAMEYYRVLRARGIPVRLLWYPEENHAISGVEAKADLFVNCAQWIMQYLSVEADTEVHQLA